MAVNQNMFFVNDTATAEIYTLSLHDALPISRPPARRARRGGELPRGLGRGQGRRAARGTGGPRPAPRPGARGLPVTLPGRSEGHTSELQSRQYLVCRLLLATKIMLNSSSSSF